MAKEKKPELWATEVRLQAIISGWFADQNNGTPPKETLARRVLDSLTIIPDEFFEWVQKI